MKLKPVLMQLRLYLPFVDLRQLQTSLSKLIAEPNDLHNSGKLFKRCGGKMIEGNVYNCRNTLFLSSTVIKGMKKTGVTLSFPFGNELVGVYEVVINITESNKMKMPANHLLLYLNKNIAFQLRELFEKPHVRPHEGVEDITKIKTSLLTIRKEMARYYYLSTVRFKEKAKGGTGSKIIDPNPENSINNIIFIDPVITLENANRSVSLKGKDYYYIPPRLHVASVLLDNGNLLYHFRRERNIFGNRHKIRQINKAIDNIAKCSYYINTCICLLASVDSNIDTRMVTSTVDSALETCLNLKDSFCYYSIKLGGRNMINKLRNYITFSPFDEEDKQKLKNKLNKLDKADVSGTVIL